MLLNGKIEAPNKFVAYLIEKANDAKAEATVAFNNAVQHEKAAQQLKAKGSDLRAQFQKYLEDIQAWDKMIVDGEPVEASAEEAS